MIHLSWLFACAPGETSDTGVEHLGRAPLPRWEGDPPGVHAPIELEEPDEDPALSAFLWEEGTVHDLALGIDPVEIARLEADPEAEVRATLTHGGESWEVGVRRKGNMTMRTFAGKPSLKIDVHAYHPTARFHGLRRLTLNNMIQDKSMLKEHVVYRLYRELGVAAPLHGYVRLTVNGAPYGLYGLVESMDQVFVDRLWGEDDEGNLYEGGYGADLRAGQEDAFTLQEDGVPKAPTDLAALIQALEAATPESLHDTLAARFELDALLAALAADLVSGNWDAYARAANNFLLYHAPRADTWHLVPWGQDQAFTDRYVPISAGWEGRLLVLCGRSAECAAALGAEVRRVLEVWSATDLHGYAVATAAAIAADCEADPRAEIPCSPDDVLSFLEERPAIVRDELGP